jgi:hypothetical protein
MKIEQVPQENDAIYEGEAKLVYATDTNGKINATQTTGWQVEIDSLKDVIQNINEQTSEALKRAQLGQTAALEYHMYHQRMDVSMLAQAMGKFKWQVKRHFNIKRFGNLSNHLLLKYATVLGIDIARLKSLDTY